MKTKNYHQDNARHVHNTVIRGAIIVDKNEWADIKAITERLALIPF